MTANITVGQNFKPVAFACYQNIKLTAKSDLVLHFVGSDNKKRKHYLHPTYSPQFPHHTPICTNTQNYQSHTILTSLAVSQWAGWANMCTRWDWTAQAQCTDVKLKQPLMMREWRPGQVWRAGKESHTAWTAGGVRAVHWLMLRFVSPSSLYLVFMDSHVWCRFFTLLWAKEYIALSVMFWQ